VSVPSTDATPPNTEQPSHLQEVLADLISRHEPAGVPKPVLKTREDYERYTRPR